MTDSLHDKEAARAGTAPANSQQETDFQFEKWFYEQGFRHDSEGYMEMAWQACDLRWRAKLDEGKLTDVIGVILESGEKPRPENIAKAIIEYMRSKQ